MPKSTEEILRELGKQQTEYPGPLKTATRAEYVTMVRKSRRKPPCVVIAMAYVMAFILLVGACGGLSRLF